ncbi:hypothetical protein [Candidatus Thiodictyon syntrophicum]|uniref:hypothetical protein n=1 Tax=Candidatus Thiodictyon syntrophicum TaxID=1166950 RepID=UPI0012FD58AF|nr:hypothetical protein [Candidatus Thiodictyon syntrophicum]
MRTAFLPFAVLSLLPLALFPMIGASEPISGPSGSVTEQQNPQLRPSSGGAEGSEIPKPADNPSPKSPGAKETVGQSSPATSEKPTKEPTKQETDAAIGLAQTLQRMRPEFSKSYKEGKGGELILVHEGVSRPASYTKDLKKLRLQLKKGANPALVSIQGFTPDSNTLIGRSTDGRDVHMFKPGSPGKIVPAKEGGMSLIDYCIAIDLGDDCKLLNGGK